MGVETPHLGGKQIMVRHVILWKLKEMPAAEQETVKADIKAGLEGLAGQIPGLTEIHVYTKLCPAPPMRT